MNYYYVIYYVKSCIRSDDDVCLSFHCRAPHLRHFPRLVGFSCIVHHFQVNKNNDTMILGTQISFCFLLTSLLPYCQIRNGFQQNFLGFQLYIDYQIRSDAVCICFRQKKKSLTF